MQCGVGITLCSDGEVNEVSGLERFVFAVLSRTAIMLKALFSNNLRSVTLLLWNRKVQ